MVDIKLSTVMLELVFKCQAVKTEPTFISTINSSDMQTETKWKTTKTMTIAKTKTLSERQAND